METVSTSASAIESFIGLVGIVTLVSAMIVFMELVSEAFKRHPGPRGLLTGLQAMFFPIGTYYYCQSEWESTGKRFKWIVGLFSVSIVSIGLSKLF